MDRGPIQRLESPRSIGGRGTDTSYLVPPAGDPDGRLWRIRFLSRMCGGEACLRVGMERPWFGKPPISQYQQLAPAAYCVPPVHEHPVPEQGQASGVPWDCVVVEMTWYDRFEP
jgi:hypothetical protein